MARRFKSLARRGAFAVPKQALIKEFLLMHEDIDISGGIGVEALRVALGALRRRIEVVLEQILPL